MDFTDDREDWQKWEIEPRLLTDSEIEVIRRWSYGAESQDAAEQLLGHIKALTDPVPLTTKELINALSLDELVAVIDRMNAEGDRLVAENQRLRPLSQAARTYQAAFQAWEKADQADSNDVFYKFRSMGFAADALLSVAREVRSQDGAGGKGDV